MRHHDLRRRQRGFSLIEVMVASMLLSLVVVVFGPVVTSSLESGRRVQAQSEGLDQLRVAMASLERELRSAGCVPAGVGATLTFSTKTEVGGASDYTVTYVVGTDGRLTRQKDGDATPSVVATNLVDRDSAFTVSSGSRPQVVLDLRVQPDPKQGVHQLTSTITPRNCSS